MWNNVHTMLMCMSNDKGQPQICMLALFYLTLLNPTTLDVGYVTLSEKKMTLNGQAQITKCDRLKFKLVGFICTVCMYRSLGNFRR